MNLEFLRQSACDLLAHEIPENISLYSNEGESWVEDYYQKKDIAVPLIASEIDMPDVDLLMGQESNNDAENAIRLYTALKGKINSVQATDRRLWVSLTHGLFYEYMHSRWPVENALNDNNTNGTVTDRYFLSRGYFRNGISRLYWLAHLTYDESLEDPFEYTRYLLSNQDLINQVDGRSFCRNRVVLRSCLKILKKNPGLSEAQKRLFFEALCKLGGVTVLDALPVEASDELCDRTLKTVLQQKVIRDGSKVILQAVSSEKTMRIEVRKGKACLNKTVLTSKPDNLYRLSIGKELEIAGSKYIITDIQ